MKKIFCLLIISLLIFGCASDPTRYNTQRGAVLGAGAGAITSLLVNSSSTGTALWIIGGALGGALLGNSVDQNEQAARDASLRHPDKRVLLVDEEPSRTDCTKVTTKEWKNGKVISETTKEVCRGKRTSNTYE